MTGTDFGVLLTRRVIEPLGLRDSFFGTNAARLRSSAVRYDGSGNPIPYYTTSTPPSGEIYASVHDLAKFAMFNLKERSGGTHAILDHRWIDELHKPVFDGEFGTSTTFGWFSTNTRSGKKVIFKGGGQPGVAALLFMVPSENVACMVLINRSNGKAVAFDACNQILSMYLPEWTQPIESAVSKRTPFAASSGLVGRWEGSVANGGANMRATLRIESSETATFAVGESPAERITDVHA